MSREKQKPSRDKREGHPLFSELKALIFTYYRSKNENVDPEWDGSEAKQLAALLASNPQAPIEHWTQCLRNRFKSDVSHGERPRIWLGDLSRYRQCPLDKFKQPKAGSVTHERNFLPPPMFEGVTQ